MLLTVAKLDDLLGQFVLCSFVFCGTGLTGCMDGLTVDGCGFID